jgi:hypothetical protein
MWISSPGFLASNHVGEKGDELFAGVTGGGLADLRP